MGEFEQALVHEAAETAALESLFYAAGPLGTIYGAMQVLGPLVIKPLNDRHANAEGVLLPRPIVGMEAALNISASSNQWRAWRQRHDDAVMSSHAALNDAAERLISDQGNRISQDPAEWIAWLQELHANIAAETAFWRAALDARDRGELPKVKTYNTTGVALFANAASLNRDALALAPGWRIKDLKSQPLREVLTQFGLDWRRVGDVAYAHPLLDPSTLAAALDLPPAAPAAPAAPARPASDRFERDYGLDAAELRARGDGVAVGELVAVDDASSLVPLLVLGGLALLLLLALA